MQYSTKRQKFEVTNRDRELCQIGTIFQQGKFVSFVTAGSYNFTGSGHAICTCYNKSVLTPRVLTLFEGKTRNEIRQIHDKSPGGFGHGPANRYGKITYGFIVPSPVECYLW